MKILVLGASGMLGFALHRTMHDSGLDVLGIVRNDRFASHPWTSGLRYRNVPFANSNEQMCELFVSEQPDFVINAAGIIKQVEEVNSVERLVEVNALLPRKIEALASVYGFRLLQFSTDCVFKGTKGRYKEADLPDATDDYGKSKYLGEVTGPKAMTLRTSIVGMGLAANGSLLDWFLSQRGQVRGYRYAIFSGLPVDEIGRFVTSRLLLGQNFASGLYHFASSPIDKYSLLREFKRAWQVGEIDVVPSDDLRIDRSLDGSSLEQLTGYKSADWPFLVSNMHDFYSKLGPRP
jgi:dTDP-4-dehydrorhamnose reductase